MGVFEKIRFRGSFRSYQQEVLDRADEFLADKKIHIVAAPGAGKTVLGLELIRRIGKNALILSPTVTIRHQWSERFARQFISDGGNAEDYVSESVYCPRSIVSVTYQTIYCAFRGLSDKESDELTGKTEDVDYKTFDLRAFMRENGIGTICLDEAHHLHSEWYKALSDLLKDLDVTVIALTATPPYDEDENGWQKYTDLCGEIDFEIIAPELVQDGVLCPHQDYVCFNYPTQDELNILKEFDRAVEGAITELSETDLPERMRDRLLHMSEEDLFRYAQENILLCSALSLLGAPLPRRFCRILTLHGRLPAPKRAAVEEAICYVVAHPELFGEECAKGIAEIFRKAGLWERGRVKILRSERVSRMLASSLGKLNSVAEIAKAESGSEGENLRMLILTDYVRKQTLPVIGTSEELKEMSIVSVFESVRREKEADRAIGALSGALVILPRSCSARLEELCRQEGVSVSRKPLGDPEYEQAEFSGGNVHKVRIVTRLLEEGQIRILVGTKSLLGEGWDSPCIDTLVLASCVGSYILSNQMRGRAIRTDGNRPQKVANIWHLATVEPYGVFGEKFSDRRREKRAGNKDGFVSADYDTLERRFKAFWGPAYSRSVVTNGIGRADIIKPPFDREGFERINEEMFRRAKDRASVAESWKNSLGNEALSVTSEARVPERKKYLPQQVVFVNYALLFLCPILCGGVYVNVYSARADENPLTFFLISILAIAICLVLEYWIVRFLISVLTPTKIVRNLSESLFETLRGTGKIASPTAILFIDAPKNFPGMSVELKYSTDREREVFAGALNEMLSPVQSPAFIIVRNIGKRKCFRLSFACPAALDTQEARKLFLQCLKARGWDCDAVYTRNAEGRKTLIWARKYSFVNVNDPERLSIGKRVDKSNKAEYR